VRVLWKNIFYIVVDEGASIYIMYIFYWEALGSLKIDFSNTMLKDLNGHMFNPQGIIATFSIDLGSKTIFIEVEVADDPMEYNFLLGRT
jgi:hypothetical protein